MAFGDKAELLAQVAELQGDLDTLRPFAAVAEEIHSEYQRLGELASKNPGQLPDELYTQAVEVVRGRARQKVIGEAAGVIATQRGAAIEAEVRKKEGPSLIAAEIARFDEEELSTLKVTVGLRTVDAITQETRARLRRERPEQIKEEVRRLRGPLIEATEGDRFERDEAPDYRQQAERKAEASITEEVRARLRAKIDQEAATQALRSAEDRERLMARINLIRTTAARTHTIPLAHLMPNDAITVELCEPGQSFGDGHAATTARTLHLSILSPPEGVARVLDDSWEQGDGLQRQHALRSGALIVIGTASDGEKAPATDDPALTNRALTRSVGLLIVHNEIDKTPPNFELNRVRIDTENGSEQLMGPSSSSQGESVRDTFNKRY